MSARPKCHCCVERDAEFECIERSCTWRKVCAECLAVHIPASDRYLYEPPDGRRIVEVTPREKAINSLAIGLAENLITGDARRILAMRLATEVLPNLLDQLGAVFVDPALVKDVVDARARRAAMNSFDYDDFSLAMTSAEFLADAIIEQMEPKP